MKLLKHNGGTLECHSIDKETCFILQIPNLLVANSINFRPHTIKMVEILS